MKLKEWLREKIFNTLYERVKKRKLSVKSWVARIEIGNLMASLSTTGLMAIGVIPMSFDILIALAVILAIVGFVGRYLDEVEDDAERALKYERYLNENPPSADTRFARTERVQREVDRE